MRRERVTTLLYYITTCGYMLAFYGKGNRRACMRACV